MLGPFSRGRRRTYTDKDATRVQAANDFLVFLTSAAGSLGSGYLYAAHGRTALVVAAGALAATIPLAVAAGAGPRCCAGTAPASLLLNAVE